jgi:hypothetical protein
MTVQVRLAPSGPPITNANGGPLVFGPGPGLEYRATLACDVVNTSTNTEGVVEMFLDASIDGGAYVNLYHNEHVIAAVHPSLTGIQEARQCQIWMPLTTGSAFGVLTTSTSVKLRARLKTNGGVLAVSSLPGSGNTGSIHLELEECF